MRGGAAGGRGGMRGMTRGGLRGRGRGGLMRGSLSLRGAVTLLEPQSFVFVNIICVEHSTSLFTLNVFDMLLHREANFYRWPNARPWRCRPYGNA